MREKAELIIQVEELHTLKNELMEQICELHGSLEQEKSKVRELTKELKKFNLTKK